MKTHSKMRLLLAGLAGLTTAGCQDQRPVDPPEEIVYYEAAPQTQVDGYLLDQEAYFHSRLMEFFMCDGSPDNPACQGGGPFLYLEAGHLRRALVENAQVSLLDPATNTTTAPSPATDLYGVFSLPALEAVHEIRYPVVEVGATTALSNPPPPHPALPPAAPLEPPIAPATYLPTVNLRPVQIDQSNCYVPRLNVLSDKGPLDAVAKLFTAFGPPGPPVTAADLANPELFGGVVVWWFVQPLPWTMYQFAFGTEVLASIPVNPPEAQPEVWQVTWAPAGFGPPEFQTERGFMVNPPFDNPDYVPGLAGLAVILLPPTTEPFTEIEITGNDMDPMAGGDDRPWTWTPIRAKVFPGRLHSGFSMPNFNATRTLNSPNGVVSVPMPDSWRCVPPGADNQDL